MSVSNVLNEELLNDYAILHIEAELVKTIEFDELLAIIFKKKYPIHIDIGHNCSQKFGELSSDDLLDELEDLDVFQIDLHPNIEENIDLNVQNDIAVEKERNKSPAYRRKTQRVHPDISNNKKTK
ncbi:hypothetical protein QTP88_010639 [Uroleucon formosanum]